MPTQLVYDDILQAYPDAQLLASGGQKVVFSYDHPVYGEVVLKIGQCDSPNALERIRREVDTLAAICSNCYPRNFEFRTLDQSRFLIIEERMRGDTLANQLTEFASMRRATDLLSRIVACLIDLWAKDIVHRDLKPQNIIITHEGAPKIIDLGIARYLDMDSLTHSFAGMGPCTRNYAAPELLQNQKSKIDHRADQFILGIVYGQLLLRGRHPFAPEVVGLGGDIPANILRGHWAKSEFENERLNCVQPVLQKMLGRQPYQRYRDPRDLQSALSEILRRVEND